MKKCPFCAEDIQDAAVVCKHCKRELPPRRSAAVTADSTPEAMALSKKLVFALIVVVVAVGLIALMEMPPSSQRTQSSAALPTPTKTAEEITAEREIQMLQAADEFEKNPERIKNNLIGVAAMLKRDDLSGTGAALKGIQAQVHVLMEGRLKDTPAIENLRALMDDQSSAASNARDGVDRRERERAERLARQGVTAGNYLLLRDGMTYEQVVEILGREGTEMSSSNIANHLHRNVLVAGRQRTWRQHERDVPERTPHYEGAIWTTVSGLIARVHTRVYQPGSERFTRWFATRLQRNQEGHSAQVVKSITKSGATHANRHIFRC